MAAPQTRNVIFEGGRLNLSTVALVHSGGVSVVAYIICEHAVANLIA